MSSYTISLLNETALLVSFQNSIDEIINEKVIALKQAFAKNNFKGYIETVPAYASLAIFYDVAIVKKNYTAATTAFEFVKNFTDQLISEINFTNTSKSNLVAIPVYYNGEDLEYVALLHNISAEEVISTHTSKPYRVFMIGFLPGFAYMGKVDESIATPRLATPRTNVKAGSVGIAGFQTGIYPLQSPGGWQIIGQTPIKIFDAKKDNPCLLQAGDSVQFISINKDEFEKLNEY
ncbi:5-oxoprolinase subunit PxpB [Ferruginibacter sp.]